MNYLKYRNSPIVHAGYHFASKLEAALFGTLRIMQSAGEISDIKCQPHVFLTDARIEMIPDFCAFDLALKDQVYFEAKGHETDVWRIKRRLWKAYGPKRLRIFKGTYRNLFFAEEIVPNEL